MGKALDVFLAIGAVIVVLCAIPLLVAYGFLIHWLLVTIGLPDDGAKVLTLFSYILMFAVWAGASF